MYCGGTRWLQAHLGSLHWLAVACTVVYFCHFIVPVAVGMVLWLVDRVQFLRFTVALLGMSFAGFVFFVLVPVAPPWLAEQHHLLPGVHSLIAMPSAVSPSYNWLNPDASAAFPSLHAAFPLLCTLALWRVTRRGAVVALVWSAAVWFSVVYLGQHYVTDGIVLALAAWLVMMRVLVPRIPSLRPRPVAAYQSGPAEAVPSVPSSIGPDTKAPDATEAVGSGPAADAPR